MLARILICLVALLTPCGAETIYSIAAPGTGTLTITGTVGDIVVVGPGTTQVQDSSSLVGAAVLNSTLGLEISDISAQAFQLRTGNNSVSFPVPSFYPVANNKNI